MLHNKWLERTGVAVTRRLWEGGQASRHPAAPPLSHTVRHMG